MRIQCPKCDQRFVVTEDFLGQTVECGSCETKFNVTSDDVVTADKKFSPGEEEASDLERFGRPVNKIADVAFQPASYQQDFDAAQIGPPRPRKVLATLAGISFMALVIIVFLFAGGKEGPMRDMETANRFLLCGFSALLGGALVLYGMSHKKRSAVLLTIIFAALLLMVPVFLPGYPVVVSDRPISVVAEDVAGGLEDNSLPKKHQYMLEIGYDPVEAAIAKYPRESVVGIFVRNTGELIRDKISRYLYNATGKVSRETVYRRGDDGNDCLILLVDQKKSIEEIAAICGKFGRVANMDKDLRLLDIVLEHSKFASLDQLKVLDPEGLDYESQNLKALQGFDPKEQMDAVKRLANSKPRALRDDITRQLMKMLPESNADMQLEIIRALKTWALPESGAGPVVLDTVRKLHSIGRVSKVSMEFLISHKVEDCEFILLELWQKDPAAWSETLIHLGGGAEILLLPKIKEMDTAHLKAAADILGDIGTEASVEFLEQLMPDMNEQKANSLQAAIDEIKKRS